jgi:UDP-GlcNAc:undecaprenyl-phosphate GlcNAc-1-phosphate transferase|tara:strand:+ start:286 stop:1281 length:996 start_codon:yes stop_codon:yes gene_type:complete
MIQLLVFFLIFNFLIFLNLDKLSIIININDKPDGKLKKHKSTVPLLGGTIFLINFLILILISLFFGESVFLLSFNNRELFSILFFILFFYLIGLYDDKFKLKPEKKFILGILICIVSLSINKNIVINSISTTFYDHTIFLNNFKFIFTIFCITILINALNFYDGINGQSLIFFIIIYSFLAYKSSLTIFYIYIIFTLLFLLLLNLKNKIFLGDNGIYLIGTTLILSIIYEHNIFKSIVFVDEIFFLLILPGYDLVRLTSTRIFKGKNAFYGDRNHIHHLLIDKFSLLISNIILLLYILTPIVFFSFFNLNFYLVLFIFTISYIILINKLSK